MRRGERIVFEAVGETRPPKAGEWTVSVDGGAFCAFIPLVSNRPILRRLSPERVAAEQDVIADALEGGRSGALKWTSIQRLEAAITAGAPKPRFYAEHGAGSSKVRDRQLESENRVAEFCGPHHVGHSIEWAARLNEATP